jgi:hypothetical protein
MHIYAGPRVEGLKKAEKREVGALESEELYRISDKA